MHTCTHRDPTWVSLFPSAFMRSDATVGFFAKDTVQVDLNVSRHLSQELDHLYQHKYASDWDVLLLHYLGLDHVGHSLVWFTAVSSFFKLIHSISLL